MEEPPRPARPRDGPGDLGPIDEAAVDGPDAEEHRLPFPSVVDASQEVVEEAALERDAVVRGELSPVLAAVDLEPFPFRRRVDEALHVAPEVPAGAAPVAG